MAKPHRATLLALGAAALGTGIALRMVIDRSSIGHLGTDEAVWGLMARHALHGEITAFFWGQAYGGTQEVFPVALLFWLFGTHVVLMRVVPIAFSVAAAFVLWRAGRRLGGEVAGVTAALLMWIWPIYAVWKVEIWSGFYGGGLLFTALVLWLALLIDEAPTRSRIAILGLVVGLAFWESLQTVAVIVPALLWLTVRRPRIWVQAWAAIPCALVGASPWLISNLRHDWWSFHLRGGASSYGRRLHTFATATFPEILNLRVPFSFEWILGRALSGAFYLAILTAVAFAAWRWRRGPRSLLIVILLAYPLVSALSALTVTSDEPRYVVVLVPVLALLAGTLATTIPRAAFVLLIAAALSTVGLARWIDWRTDRHYADTFNPGEVDVRPAIRLLERAGIDRAFAHYSVAYRMTFDSRERLIVSEADLSNLTVAAPGRVLPPVPVDYTAHRHPAYDTAVRRASRFAYVLVQGEPGWARDVRLLRAQGYDERRLRTLIVLVSPRQPAALRK